MRILLPPSETKRVGGVGGFAVDSLQEGAALGDVRARIRAALETVSSAEEEARRALKLGVKNGDERLRNLELESSGTMPALDRYTGVLYDALDAETLDTDARTWADAHVRIQSALFGLIGVGEQIPAYRLSASSRLPALSAPLHRLWAPAHEGLLSDASYVLDLRSKDYAALAPLAKLGAPEFDFVEVVARSEDGEVRALNHFNKAAKGALVRQLAQSTPALSSRADFLSWAHSRNIEVAETEQPNLIRLVTVQGAAQGTR